MVGLEDRRLGMQACVYDSVGGWRFGVRWVWKEEECDWWEGGGKMRSKGGDVEQ